MGDKLNDRLIKGLEAPAKGYRLAWDAEVKGFGVRVTAAGSKSFIVNYRNADGQQGRYTIGAFGPWQTAAARDEAKRLLRNIDLGADPVREQKSVRDAPTVADLCDRFEEEHLAKKRPLTARDYKALIRREIRPGLGAKKVAAVTFSDVDGLHRKISKRAPYLANRTVAILSKMFSLAIKWGWRTDNPAKGLERNDEQKRERYLSGAELANLTAALAALEDQQAANIFRLLLLTGARRGEVQAACWADFNLTEGVWTKPGSTTKQKTIHRVPLSAPARQLLVDLRAKAKDDAEFVFPGRSEGHRVEIKGAWRAVCIAAGIVTTKVKRDERGKERITVEPSARIHDLRHTYASVLASAGLSLPIIGALLGHSQPATTARYAHLLDDPLRAATERVGAVLMPSKEPAEVTQLKSAG